MPMINKKEKKEWLTVSTSQAFKEDMRYLKENRHNPFIKDGEIDIDTLMEFLTITNEFYNHPQKPFKPFSMITPEAQISSKKALRGPAICAGTDRRRSRSCGCRV